MLKRLILIALPLIAAEAPAPLSEAERLKVLTSQTRLLVAHGRKVEAELAAARAEAALAELMKAHGKLVEEMRKTSKAPDGCELDLEAKWQCGTSSR